MTFLTRQQQIAAGKWPTATVQTGEHGEIRLAKLSADGSMRVQAAREAAGAGGLEKERESSAALLEEACVDEQGAPLFANAAAAKAFLGTISGETLTELITRAAELTKPRKPPGDAGNSGASPSAS